MQFVMIDFKCKRVGFTLVDNKYSSPWLDKLNFDWSKLITLGQKIVMEKDRNLYHMGDPVDFIYIIIKGRVQLYLINEVGKEKTIAIIGKNGLLGEYKKQNHNYYVTSARTVSDAILVKINKKVFEDFLFEDKELSRQRLEMLSIKVELLAHTSLYLSYDNSFNRIVRMFLDLANGYGEEDEDGSIKIGISFTHQEVAYLIGTTRVTVANTVKNLMDSNLLEKRGRYYFIGNIEKLQDLL